MAASTAVEAVSVAAAPADGGEEFRNAIHGISKLDGSELPSQVSTHILCVHRQIGALRGILKLDGSRATVTLLNARPVRSQAVWGAQPHISATGSPWKPDFC